MKILLILLLLIGSGCSSPGAPSRPVTLSIFHTGNVAGELKRCGCSEKQLGGVARRKTLYDQYRSDRTLLLDSGDVFFGALNELVGPPAFYALKTATMVRAMNRIGYDAATVGEDDFAEGADFLRRGIEEADFPFLCANLFGPQGKLVFQPYCLLHRAGLRIGVVAFLDGHVVTDQYRSTLHNLRIVDPFDAARKILPGLRRRSDLVVALLHFNLIDTDAFLKANPEIDVALVGHHVGAGSVRKVGNVIVISDGALGEKLGRLTLQLDGQRRITSFHATMIPVGEEIKVDPEVQKDVSLFHQQVRRKKISEEIGRAHV